MKQHRSQLRKARRILSRITTQVHSSLLVLMARQMRSAESSARDRTNVDKVVQKAEKPLTLSHSAKVPLHATFYLRCLLRGRVRAIGVIPCRGVQLPIILLFSTVN